MFSPPGYYVHIDTVKEVREQVLKYLSVMARPLVKNKNEHPISWTQAYADVLVSIVAVKMFLQFLKIICRTRFELFTTGSASKMIIKRLQLGNI